MRCGVNSRISPGAPKLLRVPQAFCARQVASATHLLGNDSVAPTGARALTLLASSTQGLVFRSLIKRRWAFPRNAIGRSRLVALRTEYLCVAQVVSTVPTLMMDLKILRPCTLGHRISPLGNLHVQSRVNPTRATRPRRGPSQRLYNFPPAAAVTRGRPTHCGSHANPAVPARLLVVELFF